MRLPEDMQGNKFAFVGSREFPESAYVRIHQAINVLPSQATVISGGAPGVDSVAVKFARERGLKTEVIPAKDADGKFSSHRAFQRNSEIVQEADNVLAFWDGISNGTRHAIWVSAQAQKPILVIMPSGVHFVPAKVLAQSRGSVVYAAGDLLQSNANAIVNPCNTKGVYGDGLSKALSQKFQWWVEDYKRACASGKIKIGQLHVSYPPPDHSSDPSIIHFPTKDDWRNKSEISYIESGLGYLAKNCRDWQFKSIAVPKLGCGLGGLRWGRVKMYVEKSLSEVNGVHFIVYV